MRRMMRSRPNPSVSTSSSSPSISSPVIRKSASMDSMVPSLQGRLQEQLAEEAEEDDEEGCRGLPETRLQPATPEEEEVEEEEEERRSDEEDEARIQDSRIPRLEEDEDGNETHFQEVEQHRPTDFGPSSTSLGRSSSRSKTISRSIVPMMRKMFERAKSCDPDVISPHGDGTESSRYYQQ